MVYSLRKQQNLTSDDSANKVSGQSNLSSKKTDSASAGSKWTPTSGSGSSKVDGHHRSGSFKTHHFLPGLSAGSTATLPKSLAMSDGKQKEREREVSLSLAANWLNTW